MSPSATASKIASKSARGIPLSYFIYAILGLIVAACFVLIFGRVEGEEFSPEAFHRRRYHFYQIPFLRLQIGPVVREDISTALEKKIAGDINSLLVRDPAVEWDVVTSAAYPREIYFGDAKLLCDYLDMKNAERGFVWEQWTSDHPESSAEFWALVATVAKARLYVILPELFAMAEAAETTDGLPAEATRYVAEQALQIGKSQQALGSHGLALIAFELALAMQPQSAEALAAKQVSERALTSAGHTGQP